MKTFKMVDFYISAALMAGFAILSLIKPDVTFLIGYFVVGGWQIISMLVHELKGWFVPKGSARRLYHTITISILISALVGLLVTPVRAMLAFIFLFAAPVMAVYYCMMCYNETWIKLKRPLAALK